MKKRTAVFICLLVLGAALLFAHSPLFSMYDNGDGTFTVQAGYSDGSSAANAEILIENPKEKNPKKAVIWRGKLDKNGEITIKYADIKVDGKVIKNFIVVFNGGNGHILKKPSTKIEK